MRLLGWDIAIERWDRERPLWEVSSWLFEIERHSGLRFDNILVWCGAWHIAMSKSNE